MAVSVKRLILLNGHAEQGDSSNFTDLGAVNYVDFNRDGKDEAFVVINGQTSGSSNGYVAAYVFAYQNGRAKQIWSKCEESSSSELKGRSIVFISPEWRKNDAHCCFSLISTGTYGWKGSKIALLSLTHKKAGDEHPADAEMTIEQLAAKVSDGFTSRSMGSLDAGRHYVGSMIVRVEHSLGNRPETRRFTTFKAAGAWLMRNRREANLVAGDLTLCKRGICTYADRGMLHNTLYLQKITYGLAKGRPYIKAIYFIDGD